MTPKEKATDLANKFKSVLKLESVDSAVKACASITADEFIAQFTEGRFWPKVKDEINKL